MLEWLVIGLETEIAWPTKDTHVDYRGWEIVLRPETESLAPTIAIPFESPRTREEALVVGREFLSALVWVEGRCLRETLVTGGGGPTFVGKGPSVPMTDPNFKIEYLPEPPDNKTRLALALYREALNVNSVPYRFLGFYKIINMLHKGGPDQKLWINSTIVCLDNYEAKNRLAALQLTEPDIGQYLYVSGRCAVAHAFDDPIVDPDRSQDLQRLAADIPLMRALAEYAIEHEFKIRSVETIWREHIYELDGFRAILGADVVSQLKQRKPLANSLLSLPKTSIRLHDQQPFMAFENLGAEVIAANDGRLLIQCISGDGLVKTGFALNFADERLEFDPAANTRVTDDGSNIAMKYTADVCRFAREWLRNGELEVWDADEKTRLGRCRPFVPDFNPTQVIKQLDSRIQQLEEAATRRAI